MGRETTYPMIIEEKNVAKLGQAIIGDNFNFEIASSFPCTGCFIMSATKVFSNNYYSKAPFELKLVPYFH